MNGRGANSAGAAVNEDRFSLAQSGFHEEIREGSQKYFGDRGSLLVAAVYDPMASECFTATAGQGAYRNGTRIRTSGVTEMSDALAAVGFAPGATRQSRDARIFVEALEACQALRRTGSTALNLSYVAAGRFDASWAECTSAWDVAAGTLLIREAGGVVTALDGGPFDLDRGSFLAAANRPLHQQLCALVARALS